MLFLIANHAKRPEACEHLIFPVDFHRFHRLELLIEYLTALV